MRGWLAGGLLALLVACGGGGDDEPTAKVYPTEEPPCKSVPVEDRQAACGE